MIRPLTVLVPTTALLALSGCGGMMHRHSAAEMHAAGPTGGMGMHQMHERMMDAKTPEERQALMAQHMKNMPGQCTEMMTPGGGAPAK
jgi:uncharacterized protein YceK